MLENATSVSSFNHSEKENRGKNFNANMELSVNTCFLLK